MINFDNSFNNLDYNDTYPQSTTIELNINANPVNTKLSEVKMNESQVLKDSATSNPLSTFPESQDSASQDHNDSVTTDKLSTILGYTKITSHVTTDKSSNILDSNMYTSQDLLTSINITPPEPSSTIGNKFLFQVFKHNNFVTNSHFLCASCVYMLSLVYHLFCNVL